MSTLKTTNIQNPSAVSSNITLNTDGSIGGACLASVTEVNGVTTTGSITSGQLSLTVASTTGLSAGMRVAGRGITPGTTVSSIAGSVLTLSQTAGATLSSAPVVFYSNSKLITPGGVSGQLCRAWVNFNGTGTVAIRAAYNVSSITDNGAGDYTVNFTSAMPDINYAIAGFCSFPTSTAIAGLVSFGNTYAQLTTSTRIGTANSTGGGAVDSANISISVFR